MSADVQPKFHVVTYVRHGDGFEEPVVEGLLEQAMVSRDEPGDATKAVLGTIDEFVCDGSDAHEGDTKTYRDAEERVIARLHPDQRIDVTWRRYRPLIAQGQVEPGAPFEYRDGDKTVRIEARRVVPDDAEAADGSISLTDLAAFKKTLKSKSKGAEVRRNLRDALAKFEGLQKRALAEVEAYRERLGPATIPKELKAASAAAIMSIGEVFQVSQRDGQALLVEEVPETKVAKAFLKRATKDSFADALAPLVELDEKSKRFQALQQAIDAATKAAKGFSARGAEAKVHAHVERLEPHPDQAKVKATAIKSEAALAAVYDEAKDVTAAAIDRATVVMTKRSEGDLEASTEELEGILTDVRKQVKKALKSLEALQKDLSDGVCSGFVEITPVRKDGKIARWDVRFENTGDEPWIGTQSFVDSYKNDGAGFESMGLPTAGSAAVQPIYANLDYGLRPKAGTRLRISIRGRSFLEVPLPKDEPALFSVGTFERMRNDDAGYRDRGTVAAKRNEKIKETHDNGRTRKITFYEGGKKKG